MVRKACLFLICAGMFVFAPAQDGDYYDIGLYSSSGSGSDGTFAADASDGADAKPVSTDKQPADKKGRARRAAPSFSSAFSGPQKTCPVCAGARLKNNLYVDCGEGRIHVCSAACIDRVRRNPAAFAQILINRGEQLSKP